MPLIFFLLINPKILLVLVRSQLSIAIKSILNHMQRNLNWAKYSYNLQYALSEIWKKRIINEKATDIKNPEGTH